MVVSFDYTRSPSSVFMLRCLSWRPAKSLHVPLVALLGAVVVAASACVIELERLRDAERSERVLRTAYLQSERRLHSVNLYVENIRVMTAEDERVRSIVRSGRTSAEQLARIGDLTPPHVWLTAIAGDGTGLRIDGAAHTLDDLGELMRRLRRGSGLSPVLLDAESPPGSPTVNYSIHVDGAAR